MIPKTIAELDAVRDECYSMVTKRAATSGAAALVPLPGVDIAADIAMLLQLLPAISKQFGLAKDDIDNLGHEAQIVVYGVIKRLGVAAVGQIITKEIITSLLKKVGARVAAKQVLKFIPFAGQAAAAAISVAAMKYVGNSHVDECYSVCRKLIEEGTLSQISEQPANSAT